MIAALVLSIVFSLAVGIAAARSRRAEAIIIPTLDVFQSIPILGFFPIVIAAMIAVIPGQGGISLAVIFLIFTSMSWNLAFGVYEAVKSIPQDYIDLSYMANSSSLQRIVSLYIPASMSRIAYNTQISWAVGLFYLIASEIISVGNSNYEVAHGIGRDIIEYGFILHDYTAYAYCIVLLILAVIIWQFVFLRQFSLWAERYKFVEEPRPLQRDPVMRFYSWINHRSISKLFLLSQGRGVTNLTSSIARFRRGIKYAILISVGTLVLLGVGDLVHLAQIGVLTMPTAAGISGGLAWTTKTEGSVLVNLAFSFVRIWYVYFLCVLVALPVGIGIALNRKLYEALVPVIEVVASVPAPALLPIVVIIAAGSGELVAAFIIFLGMIWYILFNVMAGIRTLPAELFELKGVFRVSNLQAWRNIYLPAAATAFVTGSITAVGGAWNTLIVAEYYIAYGQSTPATQVTYGIGKVITQATNSGNLPVAYLAVLSMTVLVVSFNLLVWRRVYHYVTKRYAYNR